MVKLDLFALDAQKVKIGVILVLCHTEYLPLFKVKHKFSVTLIILKRGLRVSNSGKWSSSFKIFNLPSYLFWLGFGLC